jgi:hypothetical protein
MWFNTLPYDPEAPEIDFKNGILKLSGRCIPSDVDITLGIIFDEIFKYLETGSNLVLSFKFDYVNTSSSKKFTDFFTRLNLIRKEDLKKKTKREIEVYWFSPIIDEDMEELGKYYKENSDSLAKKSKYKPIKFNLKIYRYEN